MTKCTEGNKQDTGIVHREEKYEETGIYKQVLNEDIEFSIHINRTNWKQKGKYVGGMALLEGTEKANVIGEARPFASHWMVECKGKSKSDIILKASMWY